MMTRTRVERHHGLLALSAAQEANAGISGQSLSGRAMIHRMSSVLRPSLPIASVLALTLVWSPACAAQTGTVQGPPKLKVKLSKPDNTPLGLFPVHQLWTLALEVQPAAPPAFQGLHAFFPIEGGRIVAY